jgi:hypothetical protein
MAAFRGPRLQVGSATWLAEERSAAFRIVQQESEEFSYSARNELEWLNEHMAGIFDENAVNFAEAFKTPGKLRGKTPRTVGKNKLGEARAPLSDVFAATPNGSTQQNARPLSIRVSPRFQSRVSKASPKPASPRRHRQSPKPAGQSFTQDSGYYGSQDIGSNRIDGAEGLGSTQESVFDHVAARTTAFLSEQSPARTVATSSPEKTFESARQEKTAQIFREDTALDQPDVQGTTGTLESDNALDSHDPAMDMPSSPVLLSPEQRHEAVETDTQNPQATNDEPASEDIRSPSEGSSPIRPTVVRKSSLNFASLPAREPLVAGKSTGTRVSRTSHLDLRTSYYNKPVEGRATSQAEEDDDSNNDDDFDSVEPVVRESPKTSEVVEDLALHHAKTYTQRLQDQISLLGKSQSTSMRQSKSIPSSSNAPNATAVQPAIVAQISSPLRSPLRKEATTTTPGAFPEDDDDWIEPPATLTVEETRPPMPKSHSADIMEQIHGKSTVGEDMMIGTQRETQSQEPADMELVSPTQKRTAYGHKKSASSSVTLAMSRSDLSMGPPLTKSVTVSNPTLDDVGMSPESPSRSYRDSPLKQVKNKVSSILKISKGLLASSAAISAQGKSSILSPSPSRAAFFPVPSVESLSTKFSMDSPRARPQTQSSEQPSSPTRPTTGRRTRGSIEKEKEEKRREKEAKRVAEQNEKEAKRLAEQNEKLEKAREKEREKARVFSKEQEKAAQAEPQVASRNEQEAQSVKETPKPTRTSPRKAKPTGEGGWSVDKDADVSDATSLMPPPSAARSTGLGQANRGKEVKRPVKPSKDAHSKPKQAPTVIRVNTGSQHSQFNPGGGGSATNAGVAVPQAQSQPQTKASQASLQQKPVTQSLKGSVSSSGRPRALDLAAKKKEQDEREAQRRRNVKLENERKRAAAQEEQRKQEQQRKQEAEAQKQREADQAEAKKRQAAIERAKQTKAPPPAVRSQLNGSADSSAAQERPQSVLSSHKPDSQPARPHSRMASGLYRPYDDSGRPVNAVLSHAAKSAKRPLGTDADDGLAKRPPSRGGPTYQAAEAKRRRTSNEFADAAETSHAPNIKGPPVRPSGGFKKDSHTKSMLPNGYTTAPQSATRDLFKATVTSQLQSHSKATHPLDMAQIVKGTIPFAPNPNAAGSSYKTPARPVAFNSVKSAAKSVQRPSPHFANGENIELPEIPTDDEDDDDDESHGIGAASWADSPDLRRALQKQEDMDPAAIFGRPAPLNMEEVFNKSKDRFHKFRMRTSSANWSGTDRLTEDDIRKDMAARDKMRREGGWSYQMSKDML